jgi:pyruvyl transferase EpsO
MSYVKPHVPALSVGENKIRVMTALKNKLQILSDFFPRGVPIAYLDLPIHKNVGDLLIYLGTEMFFKECGHEIDIRLSYLEAERYLHRITPRHIIALHGGGNLGDLYESHEHLRQVVLNRFPHNQIIIFPQTVYFSEEAKIEQFAKVYRYHRNCRIFVRDAHSYNTIVNQFGCECMTLPDMAHFLWLSDVLPQPNESGESILYFLRADKEKSALSVVDTATAIDWRDVVPLSTKLAVRAFILAFRNCSHTNSGQRLLMNAFSRVRDSMIECAVCRFAPFETVVTDRLHAAILSLLLGKRVKIRNDAYRKVSNYADMWLENIIERDTSCGHPLSLGGGDQGGKAYP